MIEKYLKFFEKLGDGEFYKFSKTINEYRYILEDEGFEVEIIDSSSY